MFGYLKAVRDGLLSVAYPQPCRLCDAPIESWEDGVVCQTCWETAATTILFGDPVCCQKCGLPESKIGHLPHSNNRLSGAPTARPPIANLSANGRLCGHCSSHPYEAARACGWYAGALEANILFLKSQPHICRRLQKIIEQTVTTQQTALACDVVIPIPLHPKRRRERGFNQAEKIAAFLSSQLYIPLDASSLIRTRHTERHRAGMDEKDRQQSVAGVFAVIRPRKVAGAAILLVDDVYTTGSTLKEATRSLLEAQAKRVSILTIARVAP